MTDDTEEHRSVDDEVDLPLNRVRVLDFTRALSGPFCTSLLGDLGADVVKVEPLHGDHSRDWGPYLEGESLYFASINRNKRSIAIDMWAEQGRRTIRRLARGFDVVVENFRPGVIGELGLDDEWLAANNPDLIVASISGFGHIGPRSGEPCFDQIAQGMGGLMSLTGTAESGPMRSGIPLADNLSGMFAAIGICATLAGARRGARVNTSLLEGVVGVLTFQAQRYLSIGEIPQRAGNDHPVTVPYGVFHTADKPINLAAGTTAQWESLCRVLGAPELATDERFASAPLRTRNRELVRQEIESHLTRNTSKYWLEALTSASVPSGPINNIRDAFDEPQVRALAMVQEVKHSKLGTIPVTRGPIWYRGAPTPVRLAAPVLGEHSRAILQGCGFSETEIDDLFDSGVVCGATIVEETARN